MRIVIDMQGAQSLGSGARGVGRYTLEMVKAFALAAYKKHEIILVLNGVFHESIEDIRELFKGCIPNQNIKCWQQYALPISGIGGNDWRREATEFIREWYINQLNADIVWSTNLQEGWIDDAVTSVKKIDSSAIFCSNLHDVIPLLFPDKYLVSDIKKWYEEKIQFVINSDAVLTGSNFSKNEICRLLGIDKNKILVALNAYDHEIFNEESKLNIKILTSNNLISDGYIFYAGGVDDHKNIGQLLKAIGKLPSELKNNFPLVFAGKDAKNIENHLRFLANQAGMSPDKIICLGYVSDQDLAGLYSNSAVFVYPSYSEGFGLPVLEAMASGSPVLAANAASIPEIINFEEALFDPFDEDVIALKINKVLTNEIWRNSLIKKGLSRAKEFSWHVSAIKILDYFEKMIKSKKDKRKIKVNSNKQYKELLTKIAQIQTEHSQQDVMQIAQSIADNRFDAAAEKCFYIDLSCLVHFDHATGIQRVVRAISSELYKKNINNCKFKPVFSYAGHNYHYHIGLNSSGYENVTEVDLIKNRVDFKDGDILLMLDLHPGSAITKDQQLQQLRNRGVLVYFVVYDLLPISHPQYFVPELSAEFGEWLKTVIKSDGAMCISEDVGNKLNEWVNANNLKTSVNFKIKHFHLGADLDNSVPSRGMPSNAIDVLATIKIKKSFLMVGTVEPRKGHAFVLDAFEKMWANDDDFVLVIIGREGWRNEQTVSRLRNHAESMKRLFWLEGISDEYLEKVYATSTCLIAASEGEGFGLPLIEAAQHNLPIIARDLSVFREVAKDYAFYFNGDDPVDLSNAIHQWLVLNNEKGAPQSKKIPWLTWKQSVEQLLGAMDL